VWEAQQGGWWGEDGRVGPGGTGIGKEVLLGGAVVVIAVVPVVMTPQERHWEVVEFRYKPMIDIFLS
jgi:hypothetical protein